MFKKKLGCVTLIFAAVLVFSASAKAGFDLGGADQSMKSSINVQDQSKSHPDMRTISGRDRNGATPLMRLFSRAMRIEMPSAQSVDFYRIRPMSTHESKVAEFLIKNKIDLDVKDKMGNSALVYAALDGNAYLVDLLLKNGVDSGSKIREGKTALQQIMEVMVNHMQSTIQKTLMSAFETDDMHMVTRAFSTNVAPLRRIFPFMNNNTAILGTIKVVMNGERENFMQHYGKVIDLLEQHSSASALSDGQLQDELAWLRE